MRSVLIFATVVLFFATGCASQPPEAHEIIYRNIPEGYLQECTLPPMPEDTADLSDAFVQAYRCGEQGNSDKQKIRELIDQ